MTQYGPPKNFKVIDIATGERIAPIDWYDNPFAVDHNGYGVTEGYLDFKNVKMYQSIGLSDRAKMEIFFGDILINKSGNIWEVRFDDYKAQAILSMVGSDETMAVHHASRWLVIGNVHTPKDALKQRAEELKDG